MRLALLQLNSDSARINTLFSLASTREIQGFRGLLETELDRLRAESDFIVDRDEEMVSKGARQCLRRLLEITDRKTIKGIKEQVEVTDTLL